MNLRSLCPFTGVLGLLFTFEAIAYEQATHAWITRESTKQTEIGYRVDGSPAQLTRTLGLDVYLPFGPDAEYFEFIRLSSGIFTRSRKAQHYEIDIASAFDIEDSDDPFVARLLYGAIREDDNPTEDPPTPQDVAPGLRRPLHHFYDPAFNRPLTYPGLGLLDPDVHTNPDWAIGSRNSFADPNTPEPLRRNSFSIFDAREAMFRALTLQAYDGADYTDLSPGADIATRQRLRRAYWATAFRALGDVLHLNQDMAQPQHTRNEPHSGAFCPTDQICAAGHTSIYEKYINARALLQNGFNSGAPSNVPVQIPIKPLNITPYPVPAFAKYTDYWSTAPGSASSRGMGLADYSNRGFFTPAHNLGASEFAFPSNNPSSYVIRSFVPAHWDGSTPNDTTPAHVYYGGVPDGWQQTSTPDVPLTAYSLWDQFIIAQSLEPSYSLNRLHYDAMADLLLPRAVAYSAGLINFFFRGRLDITLPDEGVFALADHATDDGFTMLRAKVKNATSTFATAQGGAQTQDMSGGQFFAVIRYHRDRQYKHSLDTVVGIAPCIDPLVVVNAANPDAPTQCRDGVEQIVVSRPIYGTSIGANAEQLLEFEFGDSPIPFDMTDVVLQVVYRGELGSEADAVAVGTLDLSEPTYFTYQNASDYIHLGEHVYTRGQVESNLALLAMVQPQYCVDYRVSPPRLVDGCLEGFPLDLTVSFSDLAKPVAKVVGLPNRRFMRFVYLTVADEDDEDSGPAVKRAVKSVSIAVRRHGDVGKALLGQDGTCLPHDPFDIPPRHSQVSVVTRGQLISRVEPMHTLRGVNGWYNTSCVVNGDNAIPGTGDDRVAVMTPLTPKTEEVEPYAVTIMPEYLDGTPPT